MSPNTPHPDPVEARLESLLRDARGAPLPPGADRLAWGFGARTEARLREMASEALLAEGVIWRWLTGLTAATVLMMVAAGLGGRTAAPTSVDTSDPSTFQTEWASYTSVPEVWPAP